MSLEAPILEIFIKDPKGQQIISKGEVAADVFPYEILAGLKIDPSTVVELSYQRPNLNPRSLGMIDAGGLYSLTLGAERQVREDFPAESTFFYEKRLPLIDAAIFIVQRGCVQRWALGNDSIPTPSPLTPYYHSSGSPVAKHFLNAREGWKIVEKSRGAIAVAQFIEIIEQTKMKRRNLQPIHLDIRVPDEPQSGGFDHNFGKNAGDWYNERALTHVQKQEAGLPKNGATLALHYKVLRGWESHSFRVISASTSTGFLPVPKDLTLTFRRTSGVEFAH